MLFQTDNRSQIPLSEACRPEALNELFGQEHLWNPKSPLFKLVETGSFHSIIFWGPPGTGKTTLAKLISKHAGYSSCLISAVSTSVKEIRQAIEGSVTQVTSGLKPTILFVDEIHRLNKGQQDVLLPAIEAGHIKFIGATTENPSFEVNNAILSRCLTFKFKPITSESMTSLLSRAVEKYNEIHEQTSKASQSALEHISSMASGDARFALNVLESGLGLIKGSCDVTLEPSHIESLGIDLKMGHDKKGDSHYDLASALIKSIRASHPDATLYYLARLIEGGEDPMFIARRLLISASEDIGNANPTALTMATSTMQAVHMIGMPEARITLSQLATYLACSPKSNRSYEAIGKALKTVKATGPLGIPNHLKNAPTDFLKKQGHSLGYVYPHDDPNYKNLTYLPEELKGQRFYNPGESGVEAKFKHILSTSRPTCD
ncbi:replication-associated recombination protein A [bacterium]|nr:replication-associated recombination protein A [bacterium]